MKVKKKKTLEQKIAEKEEAAEQARLQKQVFYYALKLTKLYKCILY